jgi:hypothetical protein
MNSVGYNLDMLMHIRGVRRGEEISEVVLKNHVNVLVMSVTMPLIIIYKIYSILPFSMSSFKVEVLGVFVSMLEPIHLSPLGPPLFFLL